jgi:hypothetical protein
MRNRIWQDAVEGRDAIGRHQEKVLVIRTIEVADLSASQKFDLASVDSRGTKLN